MNKNKWRESGFGAFHKPVATIPGALAENEEGVRAAVGLRLLVKVVRVEDVRIRKILGLFHDHRPWQGVGAVNNGLSGAYLWYNQTVPR